MENYYLVLARQALFYFFFTDPVKFNCLISLRTYTNNIIKIIIRYFLFLIIKCLITFIPFQVSITRARPMNFGLSPTAQTTTSTFRPATISAIGIVKPGGSIIAKVVSPTLQVHGSVSPPPTTADDAKKEAAARPGQVPWKTLMAAREATALTYLKPPPIGQQQTWFMRKARTPRFADFLSSLRPLWSGALTTVIEFLSDKYWHYGDAMVLPKSKKIHWWNDGCYSLIFNGN